MYQNKHAVFVVHFFVKYIILILQISLYSNDHDCEEKPQKQISKINSSSTPWLIPEARTHDVSGVMWVCVSGPQRLGPRADDGVVLTEVQMNAGGGVTGPRANSNEAAM